MSETFRTRPNNQACRDLWGLLVIPNAHLDREKGLESIRHGLDVLEKERLRWPGAGLLNLYIRLTAEGKNRDAPFQTLSLLRAQAAWLRDM
jgi:hypothetical protein